MSCATNVPNQKNQVMQASAGTITLVQYSWVLENVWHIAAVPATMMLHTTFQKHIEHACHCIVMRLYERCSCTSTTASCKQALANPNFDNTKPIVALVLPLLLEPPSV